MLTNQYASEIDGVITYINQHMDEPLSLPQLARYAGYSPYHFTRIFKARMGLSPFYYISSLRLQKAKDLLLHTEFSVRDIGLEIGLESLGTFTTQFTKRVGVTPSAYRRSKHQAEEYFQSLQQLTNWSIGQKRCDSYARVEGTVRSEIPFEGFILIGLFTKPIPEGMPLYGTLLSSLGDFCFTGVKPGTYYLMATSVSWQMEVIDFLIPEKTLRFRSEGPIIVGDYHCVPYQQVTLRAPNSDDPPILVSIPLLMENFLHKTIDNRN